MPTHTASNQAIQHMYINGHFFYAYKFGIVTNGLGVVRDVTFYNKGFLKAHSDIVVEKKSDSPDEDKSLADSKALLPVLVDFFRKHPLISPKTSLVMLHLTQLKSTKPFPVKLDLKNIYSSPRKTFYASEVLSL